jgi:hypothetical protein
MQGTQVLKRRPRLSDRAGNRRCRRGAERGENDLVHYESYEYATFLLIRWKWDLPIPGCHTEVITVAEGYGIPYVARAADSSLAATRPIRRLAFPIGLRLGDLILAIASAESVHPLK